MQVWAVLSNGQNSFRLMLLFSAGFADQLGSNITDSYTNFLSKEFSFLLSIFKSTTNY